MRIRATIFTAALIAAIIGLNYPAHAVLLNVGDTARVNFAPGVSGPGTPPFYFIGLGPNFSGAKPFENNDSFSYSVFAPNNTVLASGTANAGSSIYTSGLFAGLVISVFPSPQLASTSFYATFTDTGGSFDLIGGQATLYGGATEFAVGTVASAVPEPSTWAMMILGFVCIGATTYRRRKSAAFAA